MNHLLLPPAFTLADITIILATKGRKEMAQHVCRSIAHRPLFFAVNSESWKEDAPELTNLTLVPVHNCRGPIQAMETALLASVTPLICFITDDIRFSVEPTDAWLVEALRVYNVKIGRREGLVAINDGKHAPNTAAFPLILPRVRAAGRVSCRMRDFCVWTCVSNSRRLG